VPLFESPLFDGRIENKRSIVELDLSIRRKAPHAPLTGSFAKIMWSHLKAGHPYPALFTNLIGVSYFLAIW